ncbi:DUF427 domain-containing protein [Stappia sp. ES.058]|uniref:DUF427 domain-containing protein n=1 Tax=Stappia sp. ES.058 TaxID=1881061 RepID=UPI000879A13B|nr:DUF427 domain-containing protein [Stappia sp. ES.058]SDT92830.1 Uncharacterized conserved protein, DUF427 family [Stappia sp. ES.058]
MSNPAPGFAAHPDHAISLHPSTDLVRVSLYGAPVAESRRSIMVCETGYPDVHYLPREDVDIGRLAASDRTTYCPFKGTATYWTVTVPDGNADAAAWSYEIPFDEVTRLKGYIAFYADRVDVEISAAD